LNKLSIGLTKTPYKHFGGSLFPLKLHFRPRCLHHTLATLDAQLDIAL
jgi:hypothetical protein